MLLYMLYIHVCLYTPTDLERFLLGERDLLLCSAGKSIDYISTVQPMHSHAVRALHTLTSVPMLPELYIH